MSDFALHDISVQKRKQHVKINRGFLSRVQKNLVQRGVAETLSTISRTWLAEVRRPSPQVVKELEAEYVRWLTTKSAEPVDKSSIPARPASIKTHPVGTNATAQASNTTEADQVFKQRIDEHEAWLERKRQKRALAEAWLRARVQGREQAEGRLADALNSSSEFLATSWTRQPVRQPLPETILSEFYLTPKEIGEFLAISTSHVYDLFGREPDVLRIGNEHAKKKTMRVPLRVLERMVRRNSNPWTTRRY